MSAGTKTQATEGKGTDDQQSNRRIRHSKESVANIHKGTGGCITAAMDRFVDTYCNFSFGRRPFEVEKITAEMVQESSNRTKESAKALDGWSPKALSILSLNAYGHIATLLCQV